MGCGLPRGRWRQRHNIAAAGGSPAAIVVNPVERLGWTRDQIQFSPLSDRSPTAAGGRPRPSTMTGASCLYSGAAVTCSLVNSSVMLSRLLATLPKCSAFQSTTIFRLPTPRKPPKSITAARTAPSRSTITSTMRPMFSLAGLRTSRPSMPMRVPGADHGDRRRRRRFLHGILRSGALALRRSCILCGRNRKARSQPGDQQCDREQRRACSLLNFQDAWVADAAPNASTRSTPEFGRAFAAPRATLPRRDGEPGDQRWRARAAGRAAPPR